MVRPTVSLAAKIGKGLATPAAPSTSAEGKAKDFFREVSQHSCCHNEMMRMPPMAVCQSELETLPAARERACLFLGVSDLAVDREQLQARRAHQRGGAEAKCSRTVSEAL